MRLALLALANAAELLPDFHFVGEDHFELGFAIGRSYRGAIEARVAAKRPLIDHCGAFEELRSYHEAMVPELMEELRGTAEGSGVDFDDLLKVSLQELANRSSRSY